MSKGKTRNYFPSLNILPSPIHRNKKGYFILRMGDFYHKLLISIVIVIVILIPIAIASWNPYEIIGVKYDASLDQIKKAYRELARKLHPDKSNLSEDDASKRFIELNKAFNILKDPDRRSRYDQFGDIEETRHSRGYYQQPHQNRQTREYWSNSHGFGRTFTFTYSNQQADSYLRKKAISSRQYYTEYLRKSKIRPFFIFFFSDFCPTCNIIEVTWSKIVDELSKYNIDSFTINVHHEPKLSQDLGINSIPHIACLIDGEIKSYYQSEISLANIVKFTRNLLPNNLVNLLTSEEDQDRYIALGPQQNKLSAIIIHNENNLKLRYLLLAFEFKSYYRFAHISRKLSEFTTFANRYNISTETKSTQTNLLIFDENINKPIINMSFKSGTFDMFQVRNQLYRWPFLKLPKLSSQQKFDDLCLYTIPKDGLKTSIRLCVILFTTDKSYAQPMRNKLIEFIELNNFVHDEKVSFAYVDHIKQSEFVTSLLLETEQTYPFKINQEESIESAIIILERHQQNNRKAVHKWISHRWNPKKLDELDRAKLELYEIITRYKTSSHFSKDKVALDLLIDEEGPSLADRVFWRFVDHIFKMVFYITSRESFSTVLILIACALITSLLLYQSPNTPTSMSSCNNQNDSNLNDKVPESNNINNNTRNKQQNIPKTEQTVKLSEDDMRIIELKAETYNGMIRLLKPGYRSIIVLLDEETKTKLLVEFKKAVWPYRRNKTLLFGYLCLDKNLQWYKCLLQEVLGVGDFNINKKNCIGTVLSLNGFKKYFRVYHAKHHEIDYYDDETDNDGSFLGFNDDEDDCDDIERSCNRTSNNHCNRSSENEKIYTVDNLLYRLPIWLDKMFDGLTKRYFLDSWPEEMN